MRVRLGMAVSLMVAGAAIVGPCLGIAYGSHPVLRLERIDPATFASDGKVRVFASVVELEGQVDDSKIESNFSLSVDGHGAQTPVSLVPFRTAAVPLDLVLVIESSALYGVQKLTAPTASAPSPRPSKLKGKKPPNVETQTPTPHVAAGELPLDRVKEALAALIESRPAKTRVLVIDYGGEVTPHLPFRPANASGGAIDDLSPDGESGDLHLVDAVRAAIVELNRPRADAAEPPARRLVVVVSDGLNAQMDRKTFRALGDAAAQSQVPIHAIAFSPTDDRGPLLNLGEIAKRSNGTFRWAKNADALKAQIETLTDELDKQYVMTFQLSVDSLAGHTFELSCDSLHSNTLRYEEGGTVFGGLPITRRSTLWLVVEIFVGLLGALLVLAIVVTLVNRARRPPATRARVVFGGGVQREIALDPRVVIVFGKERGAVQLPDPAVSTRHASLAFDGRSWVITDLGSTNGTLVDGQRIARPTPLTASSVVQLGQTRFRLIGLIP